MKQCRDAQHRRVLGARTACGYRGIQTPDAPKRSRTPSPRTSDRPNGTVGRQYLRVVAEKRLPIGRPRPDQRMCEMIAVGYGGRAARAQTLTIGTSRPQT